MNCSILIVVLCNIPLSVTVECISCELAVTMLIIMLVHESRSHYKIPWRVQFTLLHNLDWMVSIHYCLFFIAFNFWLFGKYNPCNGETFDMHLTSNTMVSERFGDGDASQIGLDLEEVIYVCPCFVPMKLVFAYWKWGLIGLMLLLVTILSKCSKLQASWVCNNLGRICRSL